MLSLLLVLMSFQPAQAADPLTACFETGKSCSETDIDHPRAEAAYRKGCAAGDFYSCARLGQLFEVRRGSLEKAAPFYERACKGGDAFGCEQTVDLRQRLCFLEGVRKFCDGQEPVGEFRVYRFLKTLDPRFANGFDDHDFNRGWSNDKVAGLFEKRVKQKNKALLKALLRQRGLHRHDGGDGEALDMLIDRFQRERREEDPRRWNYGRR